MITAAELGEDGASVCFVARLSEDKTITFGHRIGSQNECRLRVRDFELQIVTKLLADGGGFAVREFGDEAGGTRFAADPALHVFHRRHDGERIAGFFEQFAAAWRTTGEDQVQAWELGVRGWRKGMLA